MEIKQVQLKDITTKITKGTTPTTIGHSFQDRGINFIKAESVLLDGSIDESRFAFIDKETHNRLKRSQIEDGDILFSIAGIRLGKNVIVKEKHLPANTNQALAIIRSDKNKVIPEYLHYYFLDPYYYDYVNSITAQAAQPNINLTQLGELPIILPPLDTQCKITANLSAYDDLIENNTRRIQILEEMAQVIYREWFVHFRFPGHENFGMVNSGTELGEVPEGWDVQPFSKLVAINPKFSIDKRLKKPYIGMNALSTKSMLIDLGLIETKTGSSGAKFQNHDVLFPRITPSVENGKAGFVQFLDEGQIAIGSTEIIVFREKELNPEYIYFLSRENDFRGNAINSMVGASGRQRVQTGCFDKYLVANPPKELLEKFSKTVNPMFEIVHKLTKKNANLRVTRDLLLPRLVSGEVDVSELESDVSVS